MCLCIKYDIKAVDTKIIFDMRQRTVHEQYLKRVGEEIYSRGIQSIDLQHNETQTEKYNKNIKINAICIL